MVIRFKMAQMDLMTKDNEKPSMEKENGVDIECGDSETVQMAQVSCCMTLAKVYTVHTIGRWHCLCIFSLFSSILGMCTRTVCA